MVSKVEVSDRGSLANGNTVDYLLKAEKLCKLKKIRFTSLRSKVLEIIIKSKKPIKPYEILTELKRPEYQKVTKAPSVYRSLDNLVAGGLVHRLDSLGAYTYCTHPDLHKECFFFLCSECRSVEECCHPQLSKVIKRICEKSQYFTTAVTLEIKGYCFRCQKNQPQK